LTVLILWVETLASALQPAHFVVRDDRRRLLARIQEIPRGGLLRYTKLRTALRLVLEVDESATGRRLLLERPLGLLRMQYRLLQRDGSPIWRFEARGFLWAGYWRILDPWGRLVGVFRFRNPLILGPQVGYVEDADNRRMARVEWRKPMWLRGGFREATVEVYGDPAPWAEVATWAAIIRGLTLQQR
jgi:hypothetical protein